MQIIKASAGSGKTYRLAYEYIRHIIREPYNYRHVLAVTFTNKATEEMKRRILSELAALSKDVDHPYIPMLMEDIQSISHEEIALRAQKGLGFILHDYSRFSILTIDRFFQKILHAFVKELGIESDYTIHFDYDYLLSLSVDQLIVSSSCDPLTTEALQEFMNEVLAQGKSFSVLRDELASFSTIILSEEFAGMDTLQKKESLQLFFEDLQQSYDQVAGRLKGLGLQAVEFIEQQGLSVDDFYYKKNGFVTYFYRIAEGDFSRYKPRVQDALDPEAKWGNDRVTTQIIDRLRPLLQKICLLWDEKHSFLVTAQESLRHFRLFMLLSQISERLDTICTNNNILLLPFSTQLLSALIADNDAPFIYEKCGTTYNHFMIDEFQDTSKSQWKNFAPLLSNAISQAVDPVQAVTLVGDVKQSIYRWRGGDWRLLQGAVCNDMPHVQPTERFLDTNWRSLYYVVLFNNALVRKVVDIATKRIDTFLDPLHQQHLIAPDQFVQLREMLPHAYEKMEQRCAKKESLQQGYVRIEVCDFDEQQNLQSMVSVIKSLQDRGYRASDLAILVRDKKQARKIAAFLLDYCANSSDASRYNFNLLSEEALLVGASPAVGFVVAVMEIACQTRWDEQTVSLARYNCFMGRTISETLGASEIDFLAALRVLSPQEAFEKIWIRYASFFSDSQTAYLQAFHDLLIDFSRQNIADVPMFIEWWYREGVKKSIVLSGQQQAITLQTIHKSKGLEYKAVIIPFLDWDTAPQFSPLIEACTDESFFLPMNGVPIKYTQRLSDSYFCYSYARERVLCYMDNINLLYVALTRAESELYLFLPEKGGKESVSQDVLLSLEKDKQDGVLVKNSPSWCENAENNIVGNALSDKIFTFGTVTQIDLSSECTVLSNPSIDPVYRSVDYTDRIGLKFESDRYSELFNETLSARSYGILMHKLFEKIETIDQIPATLDQMLFDGELNEALADRIRGIVAQAMKDERLSVLFERGWRVYNERSILLPGTQGAFRPDRVVVKGHQAMVLDYKFGKRQRDEYIDQVRCYMQLLDRMGYTDVKGVIWYIPTGTIVEINC